MKIPSLEIKKLVEEIVDTPEGQETKYRLVMEGSGYKAGIGGGGAVPGGAGGRARGADRSQSTVDPREVIDMKFKIDRKRLASVVKILSCAVDEAKFTFDPDGARIRVVDPAHVCLIDMAIPRASFDTYSALDKEEIGLDLDKMSEVLSLQGDGSFEAEIVDGRIQAKVGNTRRKMGVIDNKAFPDPKVPNVKLPETFQVSPDEIRIAIKASSLVSDCIAIRTNPPDVVFEAGGDADPVEHPVSAVETKTAVRTLLPIDYVSAFANALPDGTRLTIRVGQDYPVYADFSFGEGAQAISGTYILAPRIENEG